MDTRRGFLPIAVGISLAVAPLGAAHADDSHHLATEQGTSALDSTLGAKGPTLTKGKTVKKDPKRNTEQYAGARPYWVQLPFVDKHKGKFRIKASVSARPFKKKGVHKKSAADRLTLTVALLKKGATVPTKNTTTLLKTDKATVAKNGVVTLSMPVSKKGAKKLRSLKKKQVDRLYITLTHAKDVYPEVGPERDLQQMMIGGLVNTSLTTKQIRKTASRNVVGQKAREKGRVANKAGAQLSSELNQVYYEGLWIYNNTPFTQSVTLNPNIQCMTLPEVTGNYIDPTARTISNPNGPFTEQVEANYGSVQVFWNNDPNPSPSTVDQWYGSETGTPADTTPNEMQALGNAGRQALNNLSTSLMTPSTYSSSGLLTAAAGVALTFGISAIVDSVEALNSCKDYGQYWGLSSTAMYVGPSNGAGTLYGTPQSWATGSFYTQGYGSTSYEIGSPANQPTSLPTPGSPDWDALYAILNNAVGQQSQSTFFHNAGMPAPIANAAGNTQWNGMANYSQGLLNWMYPNPGSCQDNNCNNAGTAIQLGYLLDDFDGPVGPQMESAPVATASIVSDPNTDQPVTQLTCQVSNSGTFVNPFSGSQGASSAGEAPELNSLQGMQGVTNAEFVVSYYAQDSSGNYLYNTNTTADSTYPGPLNGNTAYGAAEYPPTLQASENSQQLLAMNQASNQTQLNLSAGDVASLFNPATGANETPASYGCVVIPLVTWQNMNVQSGSPWGGNWPYPQVQSSGPLSPPDSNTFKWPNNVTGINLTWTGDAYLSAPVPAPN